jgi:hypothetical protein
VARIKKDRELNIIHFSFFDLLFGAFGAFVFLMIIQVITSLNMVDQKIQDMVNQLITDKTELQKELVGYQEVKAQLNEAVSSTTGLQERLDRERQEHEKLDKLHDEKTLERDQLFEKNTLLQSQIESLQNNLDNLSKINESNAEVQQQIISLRSEQEKIQSLYSQALAKLKEYEKEAELKKLIAKLHLQSPKFPTLKSEESIAVSVATYGGYPPYSWELHGNLPAGVSLDTKSGILSGKPASAGEFTFRVKVVDQKGTSVESDSIPMKVVSEKSKDKKKVSPLFMVVSILCVLLLLYIGWEKYKIKKYVKMMERRGKKLAWV